MPAGIVSLPGSRVPLDAGLMDKMWTLHIEHGVSPSNLHRRFGVHRNTVMRFIAARRSEAGLPPLRKIGQSEFCQKSINSNPTLKQPHHRPGLVSSASA